MPLQVIMDADTPEVTFEDLSHLSEDASKLELQLQFSAAARQASKANQAPVLSAKLFQLAGQEQALLVTVSSLCADAVSFQVLAEELRLEMSGQTPDGDLIQYADVTEWQHDLLEATEDAAEAARKFWREQAHVPIQLPLEAEFSSEAREMVGVSGPVSSASQELLLAVWQVLLHRMTGAPQIAVLMSSDGREYDEIKRAIGLFARYLPVSVDFDGKTPLRRGFASRNHPFQACSRSAGLVQTGHCNDRAGDRLRIPRSAGSRHHRLHRHRAVAVRVGIEKLKLRLIASEAVEGLKIDLEFDPARFRREAIEQLGTSFALLLARAVAEPRCLLTSFALLATDAKDKLVAQGSGVAAEVPRQPIHALISSQALRTPWCCCCSQRHCGIDLR